MALERSLIPNANDFPCFISSEWTGFGAAALAKILRFVFGDQQLFYTVELVYTSELDRPRKTFFVVNQERSQERGLIVSKHYLPEWRTYGTIPNAVELLAEDVERWVRDEPLSSETFHATSVMTNVLEISA